jgi:hypothetical protein
LSAIIFSFLAVVGSGSVAAGDLLEENLALRRRLSLKTEPFQSLAILSRYTSLPVVVDLSFGLIASRCGRAIADARPSDDTNPKGSQPLAGG